MHCQAVHAQPRATFAAKRIPRQAAHTIQRTHVALEHSYLLHPDSGIRCAVASVLAYKHWTVSVKRSIQLYKHGPSSCVLCDSQACSEIAHRLKDVNEEARGKRHLCRGCCGKEWLAGSLLPGITSTGTAPASSLKHMSTCLCMHCQLVEMWTLQCHQYVFLTNAWHCTLSVVFSLRCCGLRQSTKDSGLRQSRNLCRAEQLQNSCC